MQTAAGYIRGLERIGGFGGVGSINHGPLASTGNVLGVKAMTIEPEPRTVELRAPEAAPYRGPWSKLS